MIVVQLDMKWGILLKTELLTCLVPELATVAGDLRSRDAVHHDDTVRGQNCENLFHNLLQASTMTADKDGIGVGEMADIRFEEIAHVNVDAWGSETTGILLNNGLALRADLKCLNLEMWKL